MPKPWPKRSSEILGRHRIFDLLRERFVSPRTGSEIDAVIVDSPDWVNVVAFTSDAHCILVRQYRFGSDAVTLEIPGGMIDDGEAPLTAAKRELREETGYDAERWTSLGSVAPNPAFQRNRLYTFLAEGCRLVGAQEQDPGEDIDLLLLHQDQIDAQLAAGALDHALVGLAFLKAGLHRRGFAVR